MPIEETAQFYEKLPAIYASDDTWHQLTHTWIQRHVSTHLSQSNSILNLGSGGESYGIQESKMLHIDVASTRFHDSQRRIIADIQNLPTTIGMFEACLCVGSVLNYCDAALVIKNISNSISIGGKLLLEFESSFSLELIFSPGFAKNAAMVDTFYNQKPIRIWAYAENYIKGLLAVAGFKLISRHSFHHLSPAVYLITRNSNFAAKFQVFDSLFSRCPGINRFSSNVIFLCQKI